MRSEQTAIKKRAIERALRDEGFSRKRAEGAVAKIWKNPLIEQLPESIRLRLARRAAQ